VTRAMNVKKQVMFVRVVSYGRRSFLPTTQGTWREVVCAIQYAQLCLVISNYITQKFRITLKFNISTMD